MATLLKFLFSIAFGIIQSLCGGYVLSRLWAWFITPKFTSAPAMGYLDCVGIMIVFGFMTTGLAMSMHKMSDSKDEDHLLTSCIKSLAMILIVYPITLLSGYIWHQFIGG